jgi:BirA family biotin operon repressor/biotin-[acetyl-CoA-carboxylase] ligase
VDTLFIGQNLISLNEVSSTNKYAADLLKSENLPEGTVILAYHQTAGKGQFGKSWLTSAGENLTFSVILKPVNLTVNNSFLISMCMAVSVRDTVLSFLSSARIEIKWPNDILSNRNKISGILIENQVSHDNIKHVIAGVGINVNQIQFRDVPNATSLRKITGREYKTDHVLSVFCLQLEKWYLTLRNGNHHQIIQEYHKSLYGTDFLYIMTPEGQKVSKILRVNEQGYVFLEIDGNEKKFSMNEFVTVL